MKSQRLFLKELMKDVSQIKEPFDVLLRCSENATA